MTTTTTRGLVATLGAARGRGGGWARGRRAGARRAVFERLVAAGGTAAEPEPGPADGRAVGGAGGESTSWFALRMGPGGDGIFDGGPRAAEHNANPDGIV